MCVYFSYVVVFFRSAQHFSTRKRLLPLLLLLSSLLWCLLFGSFDCVISQLAQKEPFLPLWFRVHGAKRRRRRMKRRRSEGKEISHIKCSFIESRLGYNWNKNTHNTQQKTKNVCNVYNMHIPKNTRSSSSK